MIIVDTSVWVHSLRGLRPDGVRETLKTLLDADEVALPLPVRLELMAGVAQKDRSALQRSLTALPVLWPSEETWSIVERWIGRAAAADQRFGLTDLIVGALADEIGGLVWSLDGDFKRMAKLKLVRIYR